MAPLIDALRAAGVTATALELPGHGNTPGSDDTFTMAAFANLVGEAAHAHHAPPVCFGYSMGGYAALLAEQNRPGTFAAIVTLGTMLAWTPAVSTLAASRLDVAVIKAKIPAFADALAARHAGAGGWESMMQRTARLLTTLGDAPAIARASVARIGCPVHLLVGSRDDSVSFDDTQAFAASMPRGRATLLDGVPHPIEKAPLSVLVDVIRNTLTGGVERAAD